MASSSSEVAGERRLAGAARPDDVDAVHGRRSVPPRGACRHRRRQAQCAGYGDPQAGRDPLPDLPPIHPAGRVLHAVRLGDPGGRSRAPAWHGPQRAPGPHPRPSLGSDPYRRGGSSTDQGYERFEPEPDDALARREPTPQEPRPDYYDAAAAAAAREPAGRAAAGPDPRPRRRLGAPAAAGGSGRCRGSRTTSRGRAAAGRRSSEPAPAEYADHPTTRSTTTTRRAPTPTSTTTGRSPQIVGPAGASRSSDSWRWASSRCSAVRCWPASSATIRAAWPRIADAVAVGDPDRDRRATPSDRARAAVPSPRQRGAPADRRAGRVRRRCPASRSRPARQRDSFDGCAQEAEFFSGGSFVVWVGFQGASGDDVLGASLMRRTARGRGSIVLGNSAVPRDCGGYARQGSPACRRASTRSAAPATASPRTRPSGSTDPGRPGAPRAWSGPDQCDPALTRYRWPLALCWS